MTDADDLDYLESLLDEPFKQKNVSTGIFNSMILFLALKFMSLNIYKYLNYIITMMCTQYEQKLVFYRQSAVYSSSSTAMMGKGIFEWNWNVENM